MCPHSQRNLGIKLPFYAAIHPPLTHSTKSTPTTYKSKLNYNYSFVAIVVVLVDPESADVPPEDMIVISNPLAGGEVK